MYTCVWQNAKSLKHTVTYVIRRRGIPLSPFSISSKCLKRKDCKSSGLNSIGSDGGQTCCPNCGEFCAPIDTFHTCEKCCHSFIVFKSNHSDPKRLTVDPHSSNVSAMRIDYSCSTIDDNNLPSKNPFKWFDIWFQEATEHPGIMEANAMNLATSSKSGQVSARIVLLKSVTEKGFGFFTNCESEKGQQLADNPYAALTFYWESLQKQIRITGSVEKMSCDESTSYFHERPFGSQIGALVSMQTSVIPDYRYLEAKEKELSEKYEGEVVPKPEYWTGFVVVPDTFEFWCGRSNRLHDRIRFRHLKDGESIDSLLTKRGSNGWLYERLSP